MFDTSNILSETILSKIQADTDLTQRLCVKIPNVPRKSLKKSGVVQIWASRRT